MLNHKGSYARIWTSPDQFNAAATPANKGTGHSFEKGRKHEAC